MTTRNETRYTWFNISEYSHRRDMLPLQARRGSKNIYCKNITFGVLSNKSQINCLGASWYASPILMIGYVPIGSNEAGKIHA